MKKKKKGKDGWKFSLCSQIWKEKEWEIKIESDFWICNYGNGKFLNGRDCEHVALSFVLHWSWGIIAGI